MWRHGCRTCVCFSSLPTFHPCFTLSLHSETTVRIEDVLVIVVTRSRRNDPIVTIPPRNIELRGSNAQRTSFRCHYPSAHEGRWWWWLSRLDELVVPPNTGASFNSDQHRTIFLHVSVVEDAGGCIYWRTYFCAINSLRKTHVRPLT